MLNKSNSLQYSFFLSTGMIMLKMSKMLPSSYHCAYLRKGQYSEWGVAFLILLSILKKGTILWVRCCLPLSISIPEKGTTLWVRYFLSWCIRLKNLISILISSLSSDPLWDGKAGLFLQKVIKLLVYFLQNVVSQVTFKVNNYKHIY